MTSHVGSQDPAGCNQVCWNPDPVFFDLFVVRHRVDQKNVPGLKRSIHFEIGVRVLVIHAGS